ncbi:MAG: hypothetical protein ABSH08_02560 [Tepidisphaeraceae bacterium]|jgi:hypothetical protein
MNRRRGVIFVMALGIIVILTGLALVFAQAMRTEALASANLRSQAQADAVELGAEQWMLAQIDEYTSDAYTLTTQVQSDTIPVGSVERTGYFWILPADLSDVQGPVSGIVDESSKLNINNTTLMNNDLPTLCESLNLNLPDDIPYSISNWAHNGSNANGATSQDYSSLPEPYQLKGSGFETLEELLLVGQPADLQQNVMPQLLWGNDPSRNTLLLEYTQNTGQSAGGMLNGNMAGNVGLFNYLTAYSVPPGNGTNAPTGPAANRVINAFTASPLVLEALGLSQAQAESIVEARETAYEAGSSGLTQGNTGYIWAIQAAGPGAGGATAYLTGASYRYSGDIVAVSADGRAFKRVRIVVDVSRFNPLAVSLGTATPPAVIIYRKDLTAYGWPLPISQKQFQDLASRGGQLQPGWLGTALTSPGAMGQSH